MADLYLAAKRICLGQHALWVGQYGNGVRLTQIDQLGLQVVRIGRSGGVRQSTATRLSLAGWTLPCLHGSSRETI